MPSLIHPIARQQASAPQPALLFLILAFSGTAWGPHLLTNGLMHWPPFVILVAAHRVQYEVAFFLCQTSLLFVFVFYLSLRFADAIWQPQPSFRPPAGIGLLLAVPLALYQIAPVLRRFNSFVYLWAVSANPHFGPKILPYFQQVWRPLAYGASWNGVILNSLSSFIAPLLEEMCFSGILANIVLKHYGAIATFLIVPACFSLCHVIQFGWGFHLLEIYFAGMTYLAIRLTTGSLLYSIFAHLAVNFLIFLPKWAMAFYYFRTSP